MVFSSLALSTFTAYIDEEDKLFLAGMEQIAWKGEGHLLIHSYTCSTRRQALNTQR